MKEFILTHNISQTYNGKPCYLSVARFQKGQERENIQGVFFDEENLVIWAYSEKGWPDSSEATEFVIQSLLTCLPITRTVPAQPAQTPQQPPIRIARNSTATKTTKDTIQRQRETSWETGQEPQTQGVQANIPRRKTSRPRPDTALSVHGQSENTCQRDPANKEIMDYLRISFESYK